MSYLVAIYGNDGAGKSTLVRDLAHHLRAEHLSTTVIDKWDVLDSARHPHCTQFLKNDLAALRVAIAQMQPVPRLLFLFWTIATSMEGMERDQPDVILLDGYWMKHAAAEIAMGQNPALVEAQAKALPAPQLRVYLDVDPAVAFVRKAGQLTPYECACDPAMSPQAFLRHQAAVRTILTGWSRQEALTFDANLPAESVLADVLDAVRRGYIAGARRQVKPPSPTAEENYVE